MLAIFLTALLSAAPGEPAAPEAPFPSLALELAAPWSAAPQGVRTPIRPRGFVAAGFHQVDEDVRSPTGDDPDSDPAYSVDLGVYTWNDSLGLALEGGFLGSRYEIDTSSLSSEKVDVRRYLLGLRLVDDDPQSLFLYHLRGGLAYREDKGDVIDDSGTGWYVGGGVEWKLPAGFSVGPQVLYLDTDSRSATEWIFGIVAAFAF